MPPAACRELAQQKRAEREPPELSYLYAGFFAYPSYFAVFPLGEREYELRGVFVTLDELDFHGVYGLAVELANVAYHIERIIGDASRRDDEIPFFVLVARVHHKIGELAVVRQQQQSFAVVIESSYGVEPDRQIHQRTDVFSAKLVGCRRYIPLRLVEHYIIFFALRLDFLAAVFHYIFLGEHAVAEPGGDAVDPERAVCYFGFGLSA